jgi:hypothetical protein
VNGTTEVITQRNYVNLNNFVRILHKFNQIMSITTIS